MTASVTSSEAHEGSAASGFWGLTLGSIGVVFGDIGTSPLYAFRAAVAGATGHGQPVTRAIVLGVLSLILWALFTVVTGKYVLLLLRADNNGEGGTLSLMALAQRALGRRSWVLTALGVLGASMFIGDSMITPAISVLSAVEGLKLAAPALDHYVLPLTVFILVVLFSVQRGGTARVASAFGPVMIVWFATLAVMGLVHISDDPSVLAAINPWYGIHFLLSHGTIGMVTLGAVFLAVTGGEALYADLGHFGRKPIQAGWLYFVLPSLLINYFGQGALVLADPAAALIVPFVVVDMTFFSANLLKLLEGAWVPLLFGFAMAIMIWTWRRGAAILIAKTRRTEVPLKDLIKSLEKRPPHVVKGTAVFLTSDPNFVPTALLHNLKHNKVLHEHNVILTIETAQTPRVDLAERVRMDKVSDKFSTVRLRFGFMESPNVPKALVIARKLGWQFDIMATSFFVSRRSLKPSAQSGMPQWQDHLFIAMSRSANDATDYFQIPTGRVVAVGTPVTI